MAQRKSRQYWKLGLGICLVIGKALVLSVNCTLAQITPDASLEGENSQVTSISPVVDQINGGAIRGTNLFHSFEELNVGEGRSVYFANPAGINNILSRVTGSNPSQILGTLGVSGGDANLLFINPNGIIFGPNASLDLRGSFLATTASSIKFADGTQFSATSGQTKPLLTISAPIGLQFGQAPGTILNQAQSLASLGNGQVNSIGFPGGLQLQPGNTLALVGGDVVLEGGNLTALGGRIELGSVGDNSFVRLNPTEQGWILSYEGVQNFQNIELTKRADDLFAGLGTPEISSFVDATSNESSGDIQVQGRRLMVTNGSQILVTTAGASSGGNLTVTTSETVKVVGALPFGPTVLPSALFSSTANAGDAGDIRIDTQKLIVRNGGTIATTSTGNNSTETGEFIPATGQGSDLTIIADQSVEISDGLLSTATQSLGNGGNLSIETGSLVISNSGNIAANSSGTSDAGNILIQADSLTLENEGLLSTEATSGEGGNISLQAQQSLLLRNQSQISSSSGATGQGGNGGDIDIDAAFVIAFPQENSDITANAFDGSGGNIEIDAQGIFGIGFREQETLFSDITASSQFGLDGIVLINAPEVDPSQGLEELPQDTVDVSKLIDINLCSLGQDNEFIITGRGGLFNPRNIALNPTATWEDWRLGEDTQHSRETGGGLPIRKRGLKRDEERNIPTTPPLPTEKLVEAQGWIEKEDGTVVLTAEPMGMYGDLTESKKRGNLCER